MRNSDPEDEISDVDAPENRVLVPGDPESGLRLVKECERPHGERGDRE